VISVFPREDSSRTFHITSKTVFRSEPDLLRPTSLPLISSRLGSGMTFVFVALRIIQLFLDCIVHEKTHAVNRVSGRGTGSGFFVVPGGFRFRLNVVVDLSGVRVLKIAFLVGCQRSLKTGH
jgi:hypothetical protein